jgi:hypothetical protein
MSDTNEPNIDHDHEYDQGTVNGDDEDDEPVIEPSNNYWDYCHQHRI